MVTASAGDFEKEVCNIQSDDRIYMHSVQKANHHSGLIMKFTSTSVSIGNFVHQIA